MKANFTALMIGLDGSGKSTLIQSTKDEQMNIDHDILPTAGYSIQRISIPQVTRPITVIDCSGLGRHRDNWSIFYPECDGVIFVVDATDSKRLSIVQKCIREFLEDPLVDEKDLPIVFAFNKQDRDDIIDTEELRTTLGLDKIKKTKAKKITIKETSGFRGLGVGETFDWLATNASAY